MSLGTGLRSGVARRPGRSTRSLARAAPRRGRAAAGRSGRNGLEEMGEPWSMTLRDLAGAVGGRRIAGADGTRVAGVSIDSRSLAPGDLFVAIRGARFDGHRFVADALARGASAALVSDAAALALTDCQLHT